MNLDKSENNPDLITNISEYFLLEFVAVPQNFNIELHLSMHEQIGAFEYKHINLKQVKKVASAIAFSPVVSLLNNALLDPITGLYIISVLDELGLVLKTIHNPLTNRECRFDKNFINRYIRNYEQGSRTHIRGQNANHINIVIINVCMILQQNVIDEAIQIANKTEVDQNNLDGLVKTLKDLP